VAREPNTRRRTSVDDGKPASANYHANALARGLALLELVANSKEPLTLSELSHDTNLPKSTLVRLLAVLSEMEYLVRVDERPSYRLGHKVQGLATSYLSRLDLSTATAAYLRPLAASTGQTANLGLLDGKQVLHACVAEPDRPLRFRTGVGARDDLYCTGLGKLLLSELPESDYPSRLPAEPFEAHTETTLTTIESLTRDLRRTRRRGYALDDNERSMGLRCVAVGVRVEGVCLAAVSVSGASGEFTSSHQQRYVIELEKAADQLARDPDVAAALRIMQSSLAAGPDEPRTDGLWSADGGALSRRTR
jgi:DNA-binding IclR family transcriptional regulator